MRIFITLIAIAIIISSINYSIAEISNNTSFLPDIELQSLKSKGYITTLAFTWPDTPYTITVRDSQGNPLPNVLVKIKLCLVPGNIAMDGHEKHDIRNNECDRSNTNPPRPFATLFIRNDPTPFKDTHIQPVEVRTDNNGQINFKVVSPFAFSRTVNIGISGIDVVIIEVFPSGQAPVMKTDRIENKLNLQQMPGSTSCPGGGGTYHFVSQANHDCQFYGTASTNNAVVSIANEYVDRQIQCKKPNFSTNPNCAVTDDQGNVSHVQINGEPQSMRITAMNLRWGGLSDIGPPNICSGGNPCKLWNPPHATHNDGKQIDIGINGLDNNRRLLLREVITDNQYGNFENIVPCEGGINLITPVPSCEPQGFSALANHIHINFRN